MAAGTNGAGGRVEQDQPGGQLPGGGGGERPVGGHDLVGPLERPGDQPAVDLGPDRVQPEAEPGDHAEVAAAAPQRPEQVRVPVAAGRPDLAVGADDLGLDQVVDRPAEPAGQVAEAAAEGQAGHADLGDEAERGGQAVGLGGPVDVAQPAARPDLGQPGLGVDRDRAHAGQVDGQAAVGDGRPGDVVAAALDAEQHAVVAGEADRGGHVAGRGRLEDEGRGPWRPGRSRPARRRPSPGRRPAAAGPRPAPPGRPAPRRAPPPARRRAR